jgi:hypothetical protein
VPVKEGEIKSFRAVLIDAKAGGLDSLKRWHPLDSNGRYVGGVTNKTAKK